MRTPLLAFVDTTTLDGLALALHVGELVDHPERRAYEALARDSIFVRLASEYMDGRDPEVPYQTLCALAAERAEEIGYQADAQLIRRGGAGYFTINVMCDAIADLQKTTPPRRRR